jgi:hypothetical protein
MILLGTRVLLLLFSALTLLAFVALFVLTAATDRYFAWTIRPRITAAFLGAAYAAGCALELLSLRTRSWSSLRGPYLAILLFSSVSLAATLLHLDRFHFAAPQPVARFAAWFWLAVYVVVPVLMLVVWLLQQRTRDEEQVERVPAPPVLMAVLGVQSLLLLALGVLLFVAPGLAGVLWPWTLTPLTARIVAAWLLGLGLALALAIRYGDLAGLRTAIWSYAVLGVLELVVLLRYPDDVRWGSVAAWAYLAFLVSALGCAGYAVLRLRGARAVRALQPQP